MKKRFTALLLASATVGLVACGGGGSSSSGGGTGSAFEGRYVGTQNSNVQSFPVTVNVLSNSQLAGLETATGYRNCTGSKPVVIEPDGYFSWKYWGECDSNGKKYGVQFRGSGLIKGDYLSANGTETESGRRDRNVNVNATKTGVGASGLSVKDSNTSSNYYQPIQD